MNALRLTGKMTVMSTVEIAELTGKRHDNVMRDTKKILCELHGEIDLLRFEEIYFDESQREYPCFNLPESETLTLVSGYSIKLRHKIITRWQELEGQTQNPAASIAAQSKSEILMFAAEQAKEIEDKEDQLKLQAPKVLFADSITASNTCCLVSELAKTLTQKGYKVGQNKFFEWLRDNGYLSKRLGDSWNMPNQRYVEQGIFVIDKGSRLGRSGETIVFKTVKVTGKGQSYFINKFLNHPAVSIASSN